MTNSILKNDQKFLKKIHNVQLNRLQLEYKIHQIRPCFAFRKNRKVAQFVGQKGSHLCKGDSNRVTKDF